MIAGICLCFEACPMHVAAGKTNQIISMPAETYNGRGTLACCSMLVLPLLCVQLQLRARCCQVCILPGKRQTLHASFCNCCCYATVTMQHAPPRPLTLQMGPSAVAAARCLGTLAKALAPQATLAPYLRLAKLMANGLQPLAPAPQIVSQPLDDTGSVEFSSAAASAVVAAAAPQVCSTRCTTDVVRNLMPCHAHINDQLLQRYSTVGVRESFCKMHMCLTFTLPMQRALGTHLTQQMESSAVLASATVMCAQQHATQDTPGHQPHYARQMAPGRLWLAPAYKLVSC
jgi:hypothetical protein